MAKNARKRKEKEKRPSLPSRMPRPEEHPNPPHP